MKAVLMSIRPKWCELIASGEKTVEVRKTKPKLDTPFKVYIYCTKDYSLGSFYASQEDFADPVQGKVIGEFVCDRISFVRNYGDCVDSYDCIASCLSANEIIEYAKDKNGNFVYTYGWHISHLVIYDKPRELSDFEKPWKEWMDANGAWHDIRPCQCGKSCEHAMFDYGENAEICGIDYDGEHCPFIKIKRSPQSWCYVEVQK